MKKENAILKINKLGNISNTVITICKILMIIAMVFALLGTVLVMLVPKDSIKMDMGATADVSIDVSQFGVTLSEEDKASIVQGISDGLTDGEEIAGEQFSMDVNGSEYLAHGVEVEDSTVRVQAAVDTYTIEFGDFRVVMVLAIITIVAVYVSLVFAGKLCQAFRDCQSPFEENVVKKLYALAYSLLPWVILGSLVETITESIFTNHYEFMLSVNLGMVAIIVVIFVLAYIFKYGAILQQESDETL